MLKNCLGLKDYFKSKKIFLGLNQFLGLNSQKNQVLDLKSQKIIDRRGLVKYTRKK